MTLLSTFYSSFIYHLLFIFYIFVHALPHTLSHSYFSLTCCRHYSLLSHFSCFFSWSLFLFNTCIACISGNDPDAYRQGGDIHDALLASSPSSVIIDTFKDVRSFNYSCTYTIAKDKLTSSCFQFICFLIPFCFAIYISHNIPCIHKTSLSYVKIDFFFILHFLTLLLNIRELYYLMKFYW